MLHEIIYPFPNFNCEFEVWEWINNFIQHFIMDAIVYPYWDANESNTFWWMQLFIHIEMKINPC